MAGGKRTECTIQCTLCGTSVFHCRLFAKAALTRLGCVLRLCTVCEKTREKSVIDKCDYNSNFTEWTLQLIQRYRYFFSH